MISKFKLSKIVVLWNSMPSRQRQKQMAPNMNNNANTTYIEYDCFENNIYKDSSNELKIENFSRLFKSDTNQILSIRRLILK